MSKKEPTLDFGLGNNLSTGYGNLGNGFGNNMTSPVGSGLGNTFGSKLNSNDPFAELDTAYGIQSNSLAQINLNLNAGNNSFNLFEGVNQEVKPKNTTAPKNNF